MSCYVIGSHETYTLARAIVTKLCIDRWGGPGNVRYKVSTLKSSTLKRLLIGRKDDPEKSLVLDTDRTIQRKTRILARVMYSINCYSFSKNYSGRYDDDVAHFRADGRKGENHIDLYNFVCCLKSWLYQSGDFNLPDNHPKNVFYNDMAQLLKIVTVIMVERTPEYEKAERF